MRVFCPESWPQVPGVDYAARISLGAIRPRTGERTHAFFSRDGLPSGSAAHLIWQPPFASWNGWSEQPSEIAHSYLLTARTGAASTVDGGRYRYDFEVAACAPLLPALRAFAGDWALERVLDTTTVPPTSSLIWGEADGCGRAEIAGLTYLSARVPETYLELLVETVDGEMFGLLSTHLCPGWDEYHIGRRKLSQQERGAVERALDNAVQLVDTCAPYLLD
jgi:hypothetical protein